MLEELAYERERLLARDFQKVAAERAVRKQRFASAVLAGFCVSRSWPLTRSNGDRDPQYQHRCKETKDS